MVKQRGWLALAAYAVGLVKFAVGPAPECVYGLPGALERLGWPA